MMALSMPNSPEGADRSLEIWVPGIPACFATAAEKPWRAVLQDAIPQATGNTRHAGIELHFKLEGDLRGGRPFDLDNLCEPGASSTGWA